VVITVTNIAAETAGLSCSSQFTKNIVIPVVQPTADFKAVPAASCYPSKITVTQNNSTQADIMEWRLIDNNGKPVATSNADLPVFQVNASGKYTLSLKVTVSTTGQVAVAPVQIFTVYDRPRASFDVRPDIVYVPNTELSTINLSFGASSYFWDFGDGNGKTTGVSTAFEPTYVYKIEGKYDIRLVAIEDHGDGAVCTDTLVRTVLAKQGGLTKVPNAFTPNPNGPTGGVPGNDSFNDVFLPIVKGIEEFNMQIYDRWGNLVFESNSATIGWDGYNNEGRLMPAGVYVYKLTVRLSDNQRSTQIGDVTMIR
jgi:gliding motility-associated-like protein